MKKANGIVTIKVKIFDIEEETDLFVVDKDNFQHDILIGLDMISKFRLAQDADLKFKKLNVEDMATKELNVDDMATQKK